MRGSIGRLAEGSFFHGVRPEGESKHARTHRRNTPYGICFTFGGVFARYSVDSL